MRKDGTFIAVEVDDAAAADPALAAKLTEACPVDIFAQGNDGSLELVERNLDECVLCRLCLDAASAWAASAAASGSGGSTPVKVIKLYDDGAILA
jgi:ferredoxin-like protein FixX